MLLVTIQSYIQPAPLPLILGIAIALVFCLIIPLVNVFSAKFAKPIADHLTGEEIEVTDLNKKGLERATVTQDRKIVLKRAKGVKKVVLDIVYFNRNRNSKKSYEVTFVNDYAIIEGCPEFDNVKLIVLNVDGKLCQKKVYGYPNHIFTIVSSVSIALGVIGGVCLPAYSYSLTLDAHYVYSDEYGLSTYLIAVIVGVLAGVLHFLLVKLITNSFNKGGK